MSRRYLPSTSSQRPFVSQYSSDNTYQVTTLPKAHTYCNPLNTDGCYDLSETCTDVSSHRNSYEYQHIKEPIVTNCTFSDSDKDFNKQFTNDQSSFNKKNVRKVYPICERSISNTTATISLPHRIVATQLSDRPRSSLSVTSAVVVEGCGGRCQTFESVCYYFLQVAFTMGILIGVSLSIAGAVLRKSAARNLQVLIYIGVMLSAVSFVLLYIQCTARYSARVRKKVVRLTGREPIPLVMLQSKSSTTALQHEKQPADSGSSKRRCDIYLRGTGAPSRLDHQGVPWWRRKEVH